MENRRQMMRLIIEAIRAELPPFTVTDEAINCHHNYVVKEHRYGADVWLTRKGAIRAGAGELGIIPRQHGRQELYRAARTTPNRCNPAPTARGGP